MSLIHSHWVYKHQGKQETVPSNFTFLLNIDGSCIKHFNFIFVFISDDDIASQTLSFPSVCTKREISIQHKKSDSTYNLSSIDQVYDNGTLALKKKIW